MISGLLNIALVEDNEAHALLTEHVLSDIGQAKKLQVRVVVIPDGDSAVSFLRTESPYDDPREYPRPDIVLLDLNLPGTDGIDVLRIARSIPEVDLVPIVILSSSESRDDMRKAYRAGANAYVVKPIGFDTFRDVLDGTVTFWRHCNRLP